MSINCILIDDEPLARETLEEYIVKVPYLNLLGSFDDPLEAMDIINRKSINLIFSDIQMPEIDGISFLKSLKNPPFIIFITAHSSFAVEGFELDVLDYIIKPFPFERFLKAANKAQKAVESSEKGLLKNEYLPINDGHKTFLVRFADIYYVQGWEDYIKIHTAEKIYIVKKTMKTIEQDLDSNAFVRVQKSYIVNIKYIKIVDAINITLTISDTLLPIGLQYRGGFYKKLGIKKVK